MKLDQFQSLYEEISFSGEHYISLASDDFAQWSIPFMNPIPFDIIPIHFFNS